MYNNLIKISLILILISNNNLFSAQTEERQNLNISQQQDDITPEQFARRLRVLNDSRDCIIAKGLSDWPELENINLDSQSSTTLEIILVLLTILGSAIHE